MLSSSRSRLPSITGVAALTVVLLTGCSSIAQSAASEPGTITPSATPIQTTPPPSDDLFGVAPGEPFGDAVARTGAAVAEGCGWVATAAKDGYRLQIQAPTEQVDPDATVALVALTAPVGNAAQGPIGPPTAEGIGIGSTLDEALSAYPDAREVSTGEGPQRYLEVASDGRGEPLFLAYSEGSSIIWGVIATDLPAPEIAACV